jgi:hypothetical protein
MGHDEIAGKTGYTGASPFDRIAAAGFPNIATKVTVSGDPRSFADSLSAVHLIFDAPYPNSDRKISSMIGACQSGDSPLR